MEIKVGDVVKVKSNEQNLYKAEALIRIVSYDNAEEAFLVEVIKGELDDQDYYNGEEATDIYVGKGYLEYAFDIQYLGNIYENPNLRVLYCATTKN